MAELQTEIIVRGILIHDGRVLLCRNRKHGHVFLPGGHIDPGERACEALERETLEEMGVRLKAGRFIGAMEASFTQQGKPSKPPRQHHEINLVFSLDLPTTQPPINPAGLRSIEDHIEFIWEPIGRVACDAPSIRVLPHGIASLISNANNVHSGSPWVSGWE
jgi:8-oxo-dGTP pyrophosphatase MutT (NUDIX family)